MSGEHAFAPDERPLFAGSPFSPSHPVGRRLGYFAIGMFLAATSTFGNALTTVNTGGVAGPLGLYAAEASALPAIYVAINASANLSLVKARAQFGIPQVTSFLLGLYALAGLVHFGFASFWAAVFVRAASGMAAAALITLGIYYLMQAMPPKAKPLGAVIGMGLSQLGTPLARLVPVEVLVDNGLWGLHALEVALALFSLALILALPLPPSEKSPAFAPRDYLTIILATAGLLLFCQIIGQGRMLWWSDTPWLGMALAASIVLLAAAFLNEASRPDPLVHFEWIGTWGILRFAAVALVMRLALAEQTYGAVGLLTLGGLNNDQLASLFAVVAIAMLLGIVAAALTLSERRIPWQVLLAALIIAAGAWLDSEATTLTRPAQLIMSQALIGFGATLFVGPALLYGFLRMIQRGGDYLVSFVVTFSITQNVGGLMGSALLGSMQAVWARNANNALAADLLASDPQVAARISGGGASLAPVLVDPVQRAAQGAGLLGQSVAREAAVIAFNDVFRFVAILALATAAFIFANILVARYRENTNDRS
ncbi:MFS transporter [Caulobacter segnis]|uniref:MFS transporter n=1 Tax=Caulobacter segnis TaxID=88688 RepID=UPI0028637251|nr:MFS transporter [Caulobacter segnis]MDR6625845.1 MFS family permease [Caulobacter segnis]